MHRRSQGVTCVLLVLACAGCSREFAIEPDSCYNVAISEWPADSDYGGDSLEVAPPPRVRVHGARSSGDTTPGIIAELPGVMPSVHSHASWRYIVPDSLMMVWSTGYGGVVLRLGGRPDSLKGSAESFFDYRGGHMTGAMATLVDCSAEIPEGARAVRRFHVGVPLASGDTLIVGGRLSPTLDLDSTRTARVQVREVPVGAFRRATSVTVDTVGSIITFIIIDYPHTVSVAELAAELEAVIGPPTGVTSTRTTYGDALEGVGWVDRYDSISVWGRDGVRITISTHRLPR